MTYVSVLTHVQADDAARARLACARAVAERFGSRLIGLGAEMIPPLAFDGGYSGVDGAWITAMRETVDTRLTSARAAFEDAARGLAGGTQWISGLEMPGLALATWARAADLIVAGGAPRGRRDPYSMVDAGELALTSGRPVLHAPAKARPLSARKVLIAWKDSREARRAMIDALPFLQGAEAVLVSQVCAAADARDATEAVESVAAALGRHGVNASGSVAAVHHADGFTLLDQAAGFGADLIVLGCYGHSRLGEWVFGGVTRTLLDQDEVYLLLSH